MSNYVNDKHSNATSTRSCKLDCPCRDSYTIKVAEERERNTRPFRFSRLRLLLIPIGFAVEVLILLTFWALSVFSKTIAKNFMLAAKNRIPTADWYIGE